MVGSLECDARAAHDFLLAEDRGLEFVGVFRLGPTTGAIGRGGGEEAHLSAMACIILCSLFLSISSFFFLSDGGCGQ